MKDSGLGALASARESISSPSGSLAVDFVAGLLSGEAEADAVAVRERLAAALNAAGLPHGTDVGFEALMAAGQGAIDREVELKALRAGVDERQRDLASREREVEKATEADRDWSASWTKACSACWLGEGGTVPTLATVREILAAIAELGPVLEKKASLVDRIGKMEKDQAAFRDEAEALASEMAIVAPGDILDLAQAVIARHVGLRRLLQRQ